MQQDLPVGQLLEMETQTVKANTAVDSFRAAASSTDPQYEEVLPVGVGSTSKDSYQITQCEAYGVAN